MCKLCNIVWVCINKLEYFYTYIFINIYIYVCIYIYLFFLYIIYILRVRACQWLINIFSVIISVYYSLHRDYQHNDTHSHTLTNIYKHKNIDTKTHTNTMIDSCGTSPKYHFLHAFSSPHIVFKIFCEILVFFLFWENTHIDTQQKKKHS